MPSQDSTSANSIPESPAAPLEVPGFGSTGQFSAGDPNLNEDVALALLKQNEVSPEDLDRLSKSTVVAKSRKLRLAIVEHPRTPRYVSMSMLRNLFTFDLMRVALAPSVPGDIKRAAEETLIHRLETISPGEKLSLARRASGRVAGALLVDSEPRVIQAALENARLTEPPIVRTLTRPDTPASFVQALCRHPKWSLRREVRVALLRNDKTPATYAIEIARGLPAQLLKEILQNSRLPEETKSLLRQG